MKRVITYHFLFVLAILCNNSYGQLNEYGAPIVNNYKPEVFKASPKNYSIVQDNAGIIYFGNYGYVLQYDGEIWRKIETIQHKPVLSLDIDSLGVIYVSCGNEFGCLVPDTLGRIYYFPLSNQLDTTDTYIENNGKAFVADKGIYFQTPHFIHRYSNISLNNIHSQTSITKPKTWKAETMFTNSYMVNKERLFIHQDKIGLMELMDDEFQRLAKGSKFIKRKTIAMLPFKRRQIFICTEKDGLFYYTPKRGFGRYHAQTNKFLDEISTLNASALPNVYVLSTLNKGTMVVDRVLKEGGKHKILEQYNKQAGLPSEQITAIYNNQKHDKNLLWLTSYYGISKTKINSSLRKLNEAVAVKDVILGLKRHNDVLYVRTLGKVYYLTDTLGSYRFLPVDKLSSNADWLTFPIRQIWEEDIPLLNKSNSKKKRGRKKNRSNESIKKLPPKRKQKVTPNTVKVKSGKSTIRYEVENKIISASKYGMYQIDNGIATRIKMDYMVDKKSRIKPTNDLLGYLVNKSYRSKKDSTRIFLGLKNGLAIISYQNGKWLNEGKRENISASISSIAEDSLGNLWLGIKNKGVLLVPYSDTTIIKKLPPKEKGGDSTSYNLYPKKIELKYFSAKQGLPPLMENGILEFNGTLLFSTKRGLYKYDASLNKFVPDATFKFKDGSTIVYDLVEDSQNNCWLRIQSGYNIDVGLFMKNKEGIYEEDTESLKLFPEMTMQAIYPDKKGIVWISGTEGLYSYNTNINKDSLVSFNALIRRVVLGNDSVTFWGTSVKDNVIGHKQIDRLKLMYNENNITFHYAAPFFVNEKATKYRYFLDGWDSDWSELTDETKKEYMNLDPGNYEFKVQAENIFGVKSNEAIYKFKIKYPWWESPWFYLAEISVFLILILGSYFLNRRGRKTKLTEILTILTIITIFETLLIYLQGFADSFMGGVPVFVLLMHIFLSVILIPIQNFVDKTLYATEKTDDNKANEVKAK